MAAGKDSYECSGPVDGQCQPVVAAVAAAAAAAASATAPTALTDKPAEILSWKSMSFREKWCFLTNNITVEPMMACYVIPSMLASLATQNLNLEKACRVNLGYTDAVCSALAARNTSGLEAEELAVQQLVAGMQTWKTALQSGLPSILILFMGAWSDRTGLRKPCMLLPIVGEFLTSISLIACTYWFYELPMEVVGVAEAFWPAITGGWFTMFMGVFSYIADITSLETRTLRIGAANVFLSLGIPIGMALSGILYLKIGFYGVFGIATVGYVMSFVYGLVVLKEPPRRESPPGSPPRSPPGSPPGSPHPERLESRGVCTSALDFFSLRHIQETFRVAFQQGANNRRKRVVVLMVIVMVVIGPMYGEMAVWYLFVRYRFNWNEVKFSMFTTYAMVTNLIGTAVSVGVFSYVLKIDDALVGVMSCTSKILAGFVYAFATTDLMIYVGALVEIVNGTSFIAMRSIASKLVPTDELGKVNSLFGVCESLMPLVYGPMYSAIYRASMNTFPGTFFIVGGFLTLPAIFGFLWLYKEHRRDRAAAAALESALESAVESSPRPQEGAPKGTALRDSAKRKANVEKQSALCGVDNAAFLTERL